LLAAPPTFTGWWLFFALKLAVGKLVEIMLASRDNWTLPASISSGYYFPLWINM